MKWSSDRLNSLSRVTQSNCDSWNTNPGRLSPKSMFFFFIFDLCMCVHACVCVCTCVLVHMYHCTSVQRPKHNLQGYNSGLCKVKANNSDRSQLKPVVPEVLTLTPSLALPAWSQTQETGGPETQSIYKQVPGRIMWIMQGVQLLSLLLIVKAKGLVIRTVLLHSQLASAFQLKCTNKMPEQIIHEARDLRSHMDVY